MKITIGYANKLYGNSFPDDPVDVTISSSSWMGKLDTTQIFFRFSERTTSLGWATVEAGWLELPKEDARKLATAILWHLDQPTRKKMHLKFKRPRESDDDNAD